MNKKIQWLKWEDPFLPKKREQNIDLQEQKDSFEEHESIEDRHLRLIAGPYGLMPINENSITGKLYKLWVGHCNFDITESIKNKIEEVKGVEILRIWTRYRFWLGIGNLFDDTEVHQNIEKALFKTKVNPALVSIIKTLKKKYKHWVIYTDQNGDMNTIGGDDAQFLKKQVSSNEKLIILACSWDSN